MEGSSRKRIKKAVTLADVGREVGVSAMAVSAVINGTKTSSRISDETRQKILEAAARLNYRPNMAARSLVSRRMNTLGVTTVFSGNQLNLYFFEVFDGIMAAANRRGQNITVFTLADWKHMEQISRFCDGRIDGMILVAPVIEHELVSQLPTNVPFVSLHSNEPIPGVVDLESDEKEGAYQMVKHLIGQGHHRILHLAGPFDRTGSSRRLDGYRQALFDSGMPYDDDLVIETDYTMDVVRSRLREWMDRHLEQSLPDAVFCVNDLVAVSCIETLGDYGFRVPEHIAVCGFDDTLVARTTHLSSVRQPLKEMGSRAVDILVDQIDAHLRNEDSKPRDSRSTILFPTQPVVRVSTRRTGHAER